MIKLEMIMVQQPSFHTRLPYKGSIIKEVGIFKELEKMFWCNWAGKNYLTCPSLPGLFPKSWREIENFNYSTIFGSIKIKETVLCCN
jgi:hypothetical protein